MDELDESNFWDGTHSRPGPGIHATGRREEKILVQTGRIVVHLRAESRRKRNDLAKRGTIRSSASKSGTCRKIPTSTCLSSRSRERRSGCPGIRAILRQTAMAAAAAHSSAYSARRPSRLRPVWHPRLSSSMTTRIATRQRRRCRCIISACGSTRPRMPRRRDAPTSSRRSMASTMLASRYSTPAASRT